MNGVIEALHIYDERNPILSHTYTSRPLPAAHLLPLYLEHPPPRPNLIYLPNTNPPTLVFSLTHSNLLFLLTTSSEIEPLLVLEFLHRVVDVLEEFLGAPLLAHRIENNYDVVAQLLTEMCDAGTINTTEPNALRDLVEVEGFMGKLLGNLNLPTKTGFSTTNFGNSSAPSLAASNTPALPWRRANVRHTSNEMYADIVETLSVTIAPSGRPLAAFANGTIAFTSKVSGVPDIVLTLTGPSGKHNLHGIMELPVFHPCVRLSRWKERPGELSFIPPDGRFVLAGYEVDLLPFANGKTGSLGSNNLRLPVSLDIKTGLGPTGSDFEVRLSVNKSFGFSSGGGGASAALSSARGGGGGGFTGSAGAAASAAGRGFGGPHSGTLAAPSLEGLEVTVPLPDGVRNLSEVRPSRGDASYNPGDRFLRWRIAPKELATPSPYFGLRCTVVGPPAAEGDDDDDVDERGDPDRAGFDNEYAYDDEPYQTPPAAASKPAPKKTSRAGGEGGASSPATEGERDARRAAQNKMLMPSSASVGFSVRGWLPSGIRVESILVDPRRSRGLGEAVKPYKGVKYLTISKGGVEIRC